MHGYGCVELPQRDDPVHQQANGDTRAEVGGERWGSAHHGGAAHGRGERLAHLCGEGKRV